MVRCGVAIYGLDPFQRRPADHGLEPALSLRSWVAAVRRFERGRQRGLRPPLDAPTSPPGSRRVPIGYGDGWRRALTNNCDVLIRGRRHPLVGTVSMDNVTVDARRRTPTWRSGDEVGADRRAGRRADPRRGGGASGSARSTTRSPAALLAARATREHVRGDPVAWIVGGALRDALLGRAGARRRPRRGTATPSAAARALAKEVRGPVFRLSEAFGAWRVVDRERRPRLRLRAAPGRDDRGGPRAGATSRSTRWPGPLDGRRADRPARRPRGPRGPDACACSAPEAYERDPLRPLRLARLAAELGFAPDAGDRAAHARGRAARGRGVAASACSPSCAGWCIARRRARRARAGRPPRPARGGAARAGRRSTGSSRATTTTSTSTATRSRCCARQIELERGSEVFGRATPRARAVLAEPLADELTRGQALRFGALLHDIGKPATRDVRAGRPRHLHRATTRLGEEMVGQICRRLRTSERLAPLPRRRSPATTSCSASSCTSARSTARDGLPLPAPHGAGRGRGHAAVLRRPARHAGQERRARRSTRTSSWRAS